jgi:hydrogenase expression/formation protein HypD
LKVVFLGIGFETTAPGSAVAVKSAYNSGINNFYLLSAHKIMPPAMEAIIKEGASLDGFICPGHVAAITGSSAFSFIPEKYGLGCVVTGFEPADILQSIYMLVNQVNNKLPDTEIQYIRAVTQSGNQIAKKILEEVFEKSDDNWRGFGKIPLSGLKLREHFSKYDAGRQLSVKVNEQEENVLCICGDILRGLKTPSECQLFRKSCIPANPVGACMVSSEGTCNTYYKYRLND